MNKKDLQEIGNLIDERLKKGLKPIKETLDGHSVQLRSIQETLGSHTQSLTDIENRIKPLAKATAEVVVDHSKRIGKVEDRVDDLEPRVEILETVVAR